MGRIETICSYIDQTQSFADVGCDHGYCALDVLRSGKCKNVIISDVSAKSLKKAETLLADYIARGECRSVCCDGLADVPKDCAEVLIAGMGGEEIIKILKQGFIPAKFIFQPMKNAPKLRAYLIESGCKITEDDMFFDGDYYFIIKGESRGGTQGYGKREYFFGRDSLKNPLLKEYAKEELEKKKGYIADCPKDSDLSKIRTEIELLEEVI